MKPDSGNTLPFNERQVQELMDAIKDDPSFLTGTASFYTENGVRYMVWIDSKGNKGKPHFIKDLRENSNVKSIF